jgi:hypothetical protein
MVNPKGLTTNMKDVIHPEMQQEAMRLVSRIIGLVHSSPPKCTDMQMAQFKYGIYGAMASLLKLAKDGYFDIQFAAPLLQWMGYASYTHAWQKKEFGNDSLPKFAIVGSVITGLGESYIEETMKEMLELTLDEGVEAIENTRMYAEQLLTLLLETLQNSIFAFVTSQCPDITVPGKVFSVISAQLKKWQLHFKKNKNPVAQRLLGNGLGRLMQRGMMGYVELISSWAKTMEEARYNCLTKA